MKKIIVQLHGSNHDGHLEEITCPSDIVSIDIHLPDEDAESEKPKRKIDGAEFQDWEIRLVGKNGGSPGLHDSNDDWMMSTTTEEMAKFFLYASDAMRALIDFVNWWQCNKGYIDANDVDEMVKRFEKIITDAGFGTDIGSDIRQG